MIIRNFKSENIERYGDLLVSINKESQRYLCYYYKNKYFEIEKINGEIQEISLRKEKPKYLDILINSNENEVK